MPDWNYRPILRPPPLRTPRTMAWLWWTMLAAGTVGDTIAIAVHHAFGHVDPRHLAPARGGLATIWIAALASRGYLRDRGLDVALEQLAR